MKKSSKSGEQLSRREALQTLAIIGAAPALLSSMPALAQQSQNEKPEEAAKSAQAESLSSESDEPEISDEARRIGELAKARYGDRLDAEQFEELVKDINYNVRGAERMRKIRLANADEPDFVFRA